jgi:TonB family protein
MRSDSKQKIYFLENAQGQTVRAIQWENEKLHFVFRHDSKRVEAVFDLTVLDNLKVPYTFLETVDKRKFSLNQRHALKFMEGQLSLVAETVEVLPNVDLPKDKPEHFYDILKKTAITAAVLALFLFAGSFFINTQLDAKKEELKELQIVKVIDRQKLEVPVIEASQEKVQIAKIIKPRKTVKPVFKKTTVVKNQFIKAKTKAPKISQMGALGVLGNLNSSTQKGGLQLNQAQTSKGIGRGGSQGSGGIQTSIYSKGLFAAPLGAGNNANGAGGYGTKGKGGGRGGFGKMAIVGSASSFIEPIESEAWTDGGLDRNAIAAVIQRHISEVRFCYESGLQKKPNLSGRVSMKFMIGAQGSVTTAQVSNSSLSHPLVENCIRDRLKTWKFPQPQGGVNVKVNYPFVLRRVSDT